MSSKNLYEKTGSINRYKSTIPSSSQLTSNRIEVQNIVSSNSGIQADVESSICDSENNIILEGSMPLNDDSNSRLNMQGIYPVTWLPLLQSNSEGIHIDNLSNSCNLPPGTIVQLPVSYTRDTNNSATSNHSHSNNVNGVKIFGLVVGPNTMVPLQPFSLYGLDSYSKVDESTISLNPSNLIDGPNIIKIDISNDGCSVSNSVNSETDIMNRLNSNSNRSVLSSGIDSNPIQLNCSSLCDEHYSVNQVNLQNQAHWYVCDLCCKSSKKLFEIVKHMFNSHSITSKKPKCPHCNIPTKIDYGYVFSVSEQHDLDQDRLSVCQNCDKEIVYSIASLFHADASYSNIRFGCKICGRTYKHNRDLKKHERTRHGDNIVDTNIQTNNVVYNDHHVVIDRFSSKPNIFKENHQNVRLRCNLCDKFFRGPYELRRHVRSVHENRRPYACSQCDKSFRDTYELKRHSSSHQRMAANSSHEGNVEVSLASQNMASFLSNSHRHANEILNNQSGDYSIRPTNVNLSNDQTSLNSSNTMMLVDNFFCQVCEKHFRGANEFKRHLAIIHEKKYRYRCLYCSKFWRDQYDLKRHCRRSHCQDKEIDKDYLRQCLLDKSSLVHDQNRNEQPLSVNDVCTQSDSRYLDNYNTSGAINDLSSTNTSSIPLSNNNNYSANEDVLSGTMSYTMESNLMLSEDVASNSPRSVSEMISSHRDQESHLDDLTCNQQSHGIQSVISTDLMNSQSMNQKISIINNLLHDNIFPKNVRDGANNLTSHAVPNYHRVFKDSIRPKIISSSIAISRNSIKPSSSNDPVIYSSFPLKSNDAAKLSESENSNGSMILKAPSNICSSSSMVDRNENDPDDTSNSHDMDGSNGSFMVDKFNKTYVDLSNESNFTLAKSSNPVTQIESSDTLNSQSLFHDNNDNEDDDWTSFHQNSIQDRDIYLDSLSKISTNENQSSPIKSQVSP